MSNPKKITANRARYGKRRALLAWKSLQTSNAGPQQSVQETALNPRVDELEGELKKLTEAVVRQKADFDNFRKRTSKESEQARDLAHQDFLAKLLPVVDNFERAVVSSQSVASPQAIHDGVQMIATQLLRILQNSGLEKIECMGKTFDPNEHEALATEARKDFGDNCVCEELQPGYRFKNKVIRPAMVKVARCLASESACESR